VLNYRSISPAQWEAARQSLVFFFKYKGMSNSEDLAHDALLAILRREDYEFESVEDFPKVCIGFARNILKDARRNAGHQEGSLEHLVLAILHSESQGLVGAELGVYLHELLRIGKEQLSQSDWTAIEQGIDGTDAHANSVRDRVRRSRARKKLANLVEWRNEKR
jgi:hypothetical protein